MKRIQMNRTASHRADEPRRKRPPLFVLILCLVLVSGTIMSTALLGGSLGRYSQEESNVIPLVPQAEALRAVKETAPSSAEEKMPKRSESPAAASSTPAPRSTTEPWDTTTYWFVPERINNSRATTRASGYQGELEIYDAADSTKRWSTETQVDLFKVSYNENEDGSGEETVIAEDGKKVIAPGTSNFYTFTLENNGNLPLNYTISLKVEGYNEGTESNPDIPLEWQLQAGDGAPLSDWRGYSATAEEMKQATLAARRQESYTIEWRWAYEQGAEGDRTDTELGDLAAKQPLGAKATIIVYAEEDTEVSPSQSPAPGSGGQTRPYRPHLWPKTGDSSNLMLYIVLMTVSGCGLLILILGRRRRKKKE